MNIKLGKIKRQVVSGYVIALGICCKNGFLILKSVKKSQKSRL